ncbi:MAG: hypothetical protein AB9891_11055 [Anaerolineaceae bacterium]
MNELEKIIAQLEQAETPEQAFGRLKGSPTEQEAELTVLFHRMAKQAHPDAYTSLNDKSAAGAVFARLSVLYRQAQGRVREGIYGAGATPLDGWKVVLRTPVRNYVLENSFSEGPLFNSYAGSFEESGQRTPVTVKVPRDPRDNDLTENEAHTIQHLAKGKTARKCSIYLPHLLDSFYYNDGGVVRFVNVFERQRGWVTLNDVHNAFPNGLDPREMSWIWRRLLVVLGFAHLNGRIHGAVLPENIEILPDQHGLRLMEWSHSVGLADPPDSPTGQILIPLDTDYRDWYPEEIQRSEPPMPGTDIDMGARCMIWLLGGDSISKKLPAYVPLALRMFFKGCTLAGKRSRPEDAWALKEEYEDLINKLWGKLKFHPFILNPTNR